MYDAINNLYSPKVSQETCRLHFYYAIVSRAILKFGFGQKDFNPWLNNLCADLYYLVATQLEGWCYMLPTYLCFFLKKRNYVVKKIGEFYFFEIFSKISEVYTKKTPKKSQIFFFRKNNKICPKKEIIA